MEKHVPNHQKSTRCGLPTSLLKAPPRGSQVRQVQLGVQATTLVPRFVAIVKSIWVLGGRFKTTHGPWLMMADGWLRLWDVMGTVLYDISHISPTYPTFLQESTLSLRTFSRISPNKNRTSKTIMFIHVVLMWGGLSKFSMFRAQAQSTLNASFLGA